MLLVDADRHNGRYKTLSFKTDTDMLLHGLAGFFYCVLYNDVTLSK